jgi:hypothetical protein
MTSSAAQAIVLESLGRTQENYFGIIRQNDHAFSVTRVDGLAV